MARAEDRIKAEESQYAALLRDGVALWNDQAASRPALQGLWETVCVEPRSMCWDYLPSWRYKGAFESCEGFECVMCVMWCLQSDESKLPESIRCRFCGWKFVDEMMVVVKGLDRDASSVDRRLCGAISWWSV